MRKRFQQGNVRKIHGSWFGRYYDSGNRVQVNLGRTSEIKTRSDARIKLSETLREINASLQGTNSVQTFKDFVEHVFFPRKKGRWKRSTAMTTTDRIRRHLLGELGDRKLADITDDDLQDFLDGATAKLSFSTVDHLKWDLVAIFSMAVAKRYLRWNPASSELLHTPRECKRSVARRMTDKEVRQLFSILDDFELIERLVIKLAWAGLRPGEILALQRGDFDCGAKRLNIVRRVYRGDIDTPKNKKSIRLAGLSSGLLSDLQAWLEASPDTGPTGWLFPSERLNTPKWKDTLWQDHIRPKLKSKGLGWVNFQILRRTASSTARTKNIDPKIIADQFGHTVDVNLNVYTETPLERKIEAIEIIESALVKPTTN